MTAKWTSIFGSKPTQPKPSKAAQTIVAIAPTKQASPAVAVVATPATPKKVEVFAFAKAPAVAAPTVEETPTVKKRGRPSNAELQERYETIKKSQEAAKEQILTLDPNRKLFSIGQRVSIEYDWGTKFYGNVLRHDFDSAFVIVEWDGGREGNIIQAAPAVSLKVEELRAKKPRKKRVVRKKKENAEKAKAVKPNKIVKTTAPVTTGTSGEKKKRGRPRKNPV